MNRRRWRDHSHVDILDISVTRVIYPVRLVSSGAWHPYSRQEPRPIAASLAHNQRFGDRLLPFRQYLLQVVVIAVHVRSQIPAAILWRLQCIESVPTQTSREVDRGRDCAWFRVDLEVAVVARPGVNGERPWRDAC